MIARLRDWLRRRRAARIVVSDDAWARVEARLAFLGFLSDAERIELRGLARQFLGEKQMSGARGLALNPEMQLCIALQACLPILRLGLDWYRDWVGIVVYPGDFVIPRQEVDESGVVHEFDDAVLGEAWLGGPVLLSWFEHEEDVAGINVVIHEFAHKLDMRSGYADGMPPLHREMSAAEWRNAFEPAFEDFAKRAAADGTADQEMALDPYGAETPAEFFAVMSEAFFETPTLLNDEYPAVYQQLRQFYRQDPLVRAGNEPPGAATSAGAKKVVDSADKAY